MENSGVQNPELGSAQIELLEKLCNAVGVSGDEHEVRNIVLDQLKSSADDLRIDPLGNVLVKRIGKGENRLRVMLSAHMDEVGFMIVQGDEDGFFRFEKIGNIDDRLLVSKSVWIGRDHIPGVIGARPIHLTSSEERQRAISIDSMRIDVGPEAASKVKIGDRGTFATRFAHIGPSLKGKALDNRLGTALLIELVKNAPANIDLLAAFTVQEELGARGARTAAYSFNPDLAIAIDSTPANDLPTWDKSENTKYNTRLGAGPAIYLLDSGTISDSRLVKFLIETAETHQIPYQIRQPGVGGTDAMAIQRQREGIPTLSVSTPSRYLHTPAGITRLEDWQNTYRLLFTALSGMSPSILETSPSSFS